MSDRNEGVFRLSRDEQIEAAHFAFKPVLARERNPIRKLSEVCKHINDERKKKKNQVKVGPDTVGRAIHRALKEGWVAVEPRKRRSRALPPRCANLEKKLTTLFGLDDAIVLECPESKIGNVDAYDTLQMKLGYSFAEEMTRGAKDKFPRTRPKSYGLGGGRATRSFAARLQTLHPTELWPKQTIYSLAGSLFDNVFWIDDQPVLLDPDSVAGNFSTCFEDDRDLRRVRHPLVVGEEIHEASIEATRLREFGKDGQETVAILGAGLGTLQSHFEDDFKKEDGILKSVQQPLEEVLTWAKELDEIYGHAFGWSPLGSLTNDWFYVPPHPKLELTPKMLPGLDEKLGAVRDHLVCATVDDIEKAADQICLLGGGAGKTGVIDYLARDRFAGKVSIIVTSSGTAHRILDWNGVK